MCYTRKKENLRTVEDVEKYLTELKRNGGSTLDEYGEHDLVEGDLDDNDSIVIMDDIITVGASKLIAKKLLEYEAEKRNKKINCKNVAVIIDREQSCEKERERNELHVHSIIPLKTKGIYWLKDQIQESQFNLIKDYLDNDKKYQNPGERKVILKEFFN
jgi:orotate phosphoribosyltransferase